MSSPKLRIPNELEIEPPHVSIVEWSISRTCRQEQMVQHCEKISLREHALHAVMLKYFVIAVDLTSPQTLCEATMSFSNTTASLCQESCMLRSNSYFAHIYLHRKDSGPRRYVKSPLSAIKYRDKIL